MTLAVINSETLGQFFPLKVGKEKFREDLLGLLIKDVELPNFPPAIAKLQKVIRNPLVQLEDIAEVVKLDPSLASRFIRLSCSPIYSRHQIQSIEEAVMRIGLNE